MFNIKSKALIYLICKKSCEIHLSTKLITRKGKNAKTRTGSILLVEFYQLGIIQRGPASLGCHIDNDAHMAPGREIHKFINFNPVLSKRQCKLEWQCIYLYFSSETSLPSMSFALNSYMVSADLLLMFTIWAYTIEQECYRSQEERRKIYPHSTPCTHS